MNMIKSSRVCLELKVDVSCKRVGSTVGNFQSSPVQFRLRNNASSLRSHDKLLHPRQEKATCRQPIRMVRRFLVACAQAAWRLQRRGPIDWPTWQSREKTSTPSEPRDQSRPAWLQTSGGRTFQPLAQTPACPRAYSQLPCYGARSFGPPQQHMRQEFREAPPLGLAVCHGVVEIRRVRPRRHIRRRGADREKGKVLCVYLRRARGEGRAPCGCDYQPERAPRFP